MDDQTFIRRFPVIPQPKPHPGRYHGPVLPATWERYGEILETVGGHLLPVCRDAAHLLEAIQGCLAFAKGRVVISEAAAQLVELSELKKPDPAAGPRQFADVELGILTAQMAVAENAALLFDATDLPDRAFAFLPQHLLVLVPVEVLVGGFSEAQSTLADRLSQFGFRHHHHALWMSGPSKTADIEQTLVIGAHGTRSLSVLPYALEAVA